MKLADLGPRIAIMGPSNAGKSTLAIAIGQKLGLPVVHLDRLFHLPNTDWVPRPAEAFEALHDEAILGDGWVMEGNYTRLMPKRLARATGLIQIDVSTWTSLRRYFPRTLLQKERPGNLEGCQDTVKWAMVKHIAVTTRANRQRYTKMFETFGVPKIRLGSAREIDVFYRRERLSRP